VISIELFAKEDSFREYARDEEIFREGEPGDTMFVVLEGTVKLLVKGRVMEALGPGGVLGEMTMIDGSPRSATAIARTDARLVPIDQRRFKFLVQQTPNFSLQVMRVLADRLRRMDDRM
jgi:CRP-like cAMP-binding protein